MTMMINILWYFFIYAFLGWCTEVVYAALKTGSFANRGFLNGPACPIYGFGILLVIHLLNPVKDNVLYMFLGSVIITSAIEFVGGYALEKMFHERWWDYSDMPFNVGGYICPMYSLAWGLACLVIVDRIQPLIHSLVNLIPQTASMVILVVVSCLFIVDLIATVKSVLNLNKKLEIIDEITLKIREASDNIGESLASGTIALVQKKEDFEESLEADLAEMKEAQQEVSAHRKQAINELMKANRELLEAIPFGQKRLLKAFPGLKSIKHKDALEKLRDTISKGFGS
ncbi:MAG: hypothetical protein H6Q58_2046 [Firmicutes bacterium]|nr:hypothetical protein [Bacillota bacterium]